MRLTPFALLLLLTPAAFAQDAAQATSDPNAPLTLAQTMADPDWIGTPIEAAWWSWDGQRAYTQRKRKGTTIRDTWVQPISGGAAAALDGAARADADGEQPVYDTQRTRMAYVRNGDVFVRDLRSGALQQLTRTNDDESQPQWGSDGGLSWRVGNDWYRWTNAGGVRQAATVLAEKSPDTKPGADDLRERQLRLIDTLRNDRAQREAARAQDKAWRLADPTRAPVPAYLGDDVEIADSGLSPDGNWLLVVTTRKGADLGTEGKMPKYVTESGYEEFEDVRTRVGRNAPAAQRLWLVKVGDGSVRELKFDTLPGIAVDPMAAFRKAAKQEPLKGNRDVQVLTSGDNAGASAIHWTADGRQAAVMVRAIDNKDRWLASVDLANAKLQPRHRLTDPAWINWGFNDFGFAPDGALWFLSEESGYAHLYLSENGGAPRALTSGNWEASAPQLSKDGTRFLFLCNREWPGDYEVCEVGRTGGAVREVTALDGVEDFVVSPDESKLLVRHSDSYVPPQLAVVNRNGEGLAELTDTRTPEFKARTWVAPEYVQVPSKHGAGTIWGKYYGPKTLEAGRHYPIVMFVHGAGYLQNVSDRYPNYFREQMFHNLLVQRGYIVLDLDYRASEGYGRTWRTDIYRRMGTPELEDYLDGLDWLVANKHGDRDRAGIYGGSYGGFMAFMALFKKPGTFKAGAALRPVTDWSQYNHEYTSNILNTPELDPEAYKVSSPIEYAAGLQDHLLIAHGMIDDNVFFRDSVVLTQKLIELRKDKWELAPYPLERHGFTHPDSWYDEYRRILELFDDTLQPQR
ncbi:Dipeptidyl peptidase IV [Lysobacter dokdonensis DS-58]|uniref:Dipeptidyl peptidase IV n=1 Tax=Lysobacter dokdonensis DS-58 TaxID=1300345 RepID=A0A0A2WJ71_9GAMM|nr:S9 family peptidase [Lysobacter dokdonensis]KGQ20206.1 Dipeptidyl peptidase IV [Lysobacter dokdonensis DS-58]